MLQPKNRNQKYNDLFTDVDRGLIKIPKFQREFVWSKEQTAKLIDSLIKGFPIGTFIYWETRDELRYIKNIGNAPLPDTLKGHIVSYILDGQQRITSLYAVRKGVLWTREDGYEINYKDVSINLALDPDADEQVVVVEPPEDAPSISVHKLLNGSLTELTKEYGKDVDLIEKIDIYRTRLTGYDFSTIVIADYPIDVACEVFTRINKGGTELTLFEIMVAKTYDEKRKFDLAREYERLIDNKKGAEKDLEDVGFETIPSSTVLQCMSAYLCQQVRGKDILKLNKSDFIDNWSTIKNGLFHAVDYIRTHLRIPVSQLLPYNSLLVPLTYFFIRNGGKAPSVLQDKLLRQYFWWASLSGRFSSAADSKIARDLERMDNIRAEKPPSYRGEEVKLTMDDLRWYWFSTGDAFCKAILCLYAYFRPMSFKYNSPTTIDNSWLIRSNSKNYHHFFPKSYLKKQEYEDWKANSILNITIVDEQLNKGDIRASAPSKYMKTFKTTNRELSNTMKTHLIDDIDAYGIWNDDYYTFIECRGQRVLKELKKRLEPKL
ncbi:MAG: hypothetical protein BroJett011_30890 [Chloroflexota bacterium]|nr:MAG: hypothetical protein BroJett011_30890 [Chloroflexota bacterium]